jgi:hypothetical protein
MSLISWYKLDGDAIDCISGNNGTLVGGITYGSGKIGQCNISSGVGMYTTGGVWNLTGNFTSSFWAKKNGTTSDEYHGLVGTSNHITTTGFGVFLKDGLDTTVYIDTYNGTTRTYYDLIVPNSVTQWNHYALLYKDGWVSFYFNGSLIDRRQLTIQHHATNTWTMGRWASSLSGYYLNGNLDNVRIFDHALSAKEIKEESRAKILHYKFDDFQEPTTNLVPTSTITPYAPYHSLTKSGNNISMTILSEYTTGIVAITMQCAAFLPLYNKVLSFSGYLKRNGKPASFNGTDISLDYQASGRFYFDLTSGYFEATQYYENSGGSPWFIQALMDGVVGDVITIDNFQIEEKYHNTPYTESSRTAVIRDCSGYGNDITVVDPDAPAWESDGVHGIGKYKFYKDGGKDRITLTSNDTINCKRTASISLWFKINYWSGTYTTIFGKTDDTGSIPSRTYAIVVENNGVVSVSITDTAGTHNYFDSAAGSVVIDNWYNFVLVIDRDSTVMTGYLNGVQCGTTTTSALDSITHSYPLSIGERTATYTSTSADITDVRMYAIALSASDVLDVYKSRGSIDTNGNLHVKSLIETNHVPLLLDYTTWQDGQTGSVGVFQANGTSAENRRLLGRDPWNKETVLWEAGADIDNDQDGGWDSNAWMTVDPTKTYRFSCWIRRSVIGNGTTYFGLWATGADVVNAVTGVSDANPYFSSVTCTSTEWLLFVGHVLPAGVIGAKHTDSWIYKVDGTKIATQNDFSFQAGTTGVSHRAYLFYSTDLTTRQQFVYPRVDLCDGNEPTISELLEGHDSRNIDLVRSIGATNPINMHIGPITHINTISEIGPTENLLVYMPLEKDIIDYSGNDLGGVTSVGLVSTPGINNKPCYDFNGTTSVIRGSELRNVINTVNNSWSAWCYPQTHTNAFSMMFGHYLPYMGMRDTGRFRFSANISGSQQFVESTPAYTDNSWYHITGTYDGSIIRLYVNGELQGQGSWPGVMVFDNNSSVLSIGHWSNITVPDALFFDGKIQDVRVYNKTLTAEEIMTLYQVTNPLTTKLKISKRRLYLGGKIKETF